MSVNFNSVSLTYNGHDINITNIIDEGHPPDFRRVTIFLDDGDYEEVQHVDEFDMNIDSLIEALHKAKELIDWHIDANEMLNKKKG
tara:strand:+ start:1742 stop:1999 length:258 start_codon:yes stop_codon:yes gene_type:complete